MVAWGSPHGHPGNDQAEAEARLPTNLSGDKHDLYSAGLSEDLHRILHQLVDTDPQNLYRLARLTGKVVPPSIGLGCNS